MVINVVRVSSPSELAWAGGLFEGEGCFTGSFRVKPTGSVFYQPAVKLSMTDEAVVRRFHKVIGLGTVVPKRSKTKPQWQWKVSSVSGVIWVFHMLAPWLSETRHRRAAEVMALSGPHPKGLPEHVKPKPKKKRKRKK